MSLAPKIRAIPTPVAPSEPDRSLVQVVRETVVVKEPAPAPKGWSFVPIYNNDDRLIEIIARPIE